MEWFIFYLVIVNVIGFIQMAVDKRKAQYNKWRLPEKQLWFVSSIFGAPGTYFGMRFFRHKTKHKLFKFGLPVLSLLELIVIVFIFAYFDWSL
ncbi:hypothetical protein GCM10012290_19360 [Halolactibacillus alkaliphilus]|uniref:Uncharacterized protein n=1 Tax=Halolactibacillus alkaliphilus TaxID=442899 RepID=A0A511X336_9BACI|nr:DUF1294 domain-containing protein [Halolactibacillus alkaliphilus]GEN57335.1 hypothetical protein HAL01_17990 [Halolactibacillus alkaliphilus]GGN72978.1 hypothetical protein GCM10012290_19360 [Halolactibacillus alkaliphilus]SFO93077.1 Uncharacterized membrane protein YsdA, DUF1294 family [Halolactibacillus alkaliphilus]